MPFTNGVFANVSGASSATAGQIVQSAVWDAIHVDYSDAFNQLMNQILPSYPYRNLIINGGMEVFQRGAGASSTINIAASNTAYTIDRWYITTQANQASTVTATTGLSSQSSQAVQVQRDSGQTGTGQMIFGYPLETVEIARMRGYALAFRALLQAGANFSPASGSLQVAFYTGTGSEGKQSTFTGVTTIFATSVALTTTIVSLTETSSTVVPTNATQAELQFTWTPSGTAGTTDAFLIDDVQVEAVLNSTYTPTQFERIPFPVTQHLLKRHYQKTQPYGTAATTSVSAGIIGGVTTIVPVSNQQTAVFWVMPVEMRTTPSISTYNPDGATSRWRNITLNGSVDANVSIVGPKSAMIYTTATGPITVGAAGFVVIHAAASAGL